MSGLVVNVGKNGLIWGDDAHKPEHVIVPRFPFISFQIPLLPLLVFQFSFPGVVGLLLYRCFPIVGEKLVQVTSRVCFYVKREGFKSTASK